MKLTSKSYLLHTFAICFILLSAINLTHAQWVQVGTPGQGFVTSFVVSGTNLFAGTTVPGLPQGGVFLSTDSGATWTSTALPSCRVSSLIASSTDLFAGIDGDSYPGVFRSTNNGTSWTGPTGIQVYSLAVIGSNLFAGGYHSGVFRSTDNGVSWTQTALTNQMVNTFAVSGTTLFAGTLEGVYRSTNYGVSWTLVNGTSVYPVAVSGSNLFAGCNNGVILSTDDGASWTQTALTISDIYVLTTYGNNIFAASFYNGGGLFLSTNNGISWSLVNAGLTNTIVNAITVWGTNAYIGTGDGNVWKRPLSEMISSDSGLVAYYPFNGNANDSSGNGNNGTVNGATLTTDRFGGSNSAYFFNATASSGDYIDLTNSSSFPTGSTPRTLGVWFKLSDGGSDDGMLFTYGAHAVNRRFSFVVRKATQSIILETTDQGRTFDWVPDSNWHFLVALYPPGETTVDKIKLYFDGIEKVTNSEGASPTGTMNTGADFRRINGIPGWSTMFFRGTLDDIRMYNRALNQIEIDSLYHEGGWATGLPTNGLVAFYPFNGNANDESGNGNNGTVHGATSTTDRFGNVNTAYSFNGSTSWIGGSADQFPTTERSVSLWFYANDLSVGRELFGYGGGTCGTSWIQLMNNQDIGGNTYEIQSHCAINRLDAPYIIPPVDQWHHWFSSTSAAGTKMYVDGLLIGSNATYANNTNVSGTDFVFGSEVGPNGIGPYDGGVYTTYFDGKLDDIRIYNRALSDAEIQALYHEGGSTDTTTLWKLQLNASIAGNVDNSNYLGIGNGATDGFDAASDIPDAPQPPGSYIQLYFPHPEWGSILGDNFAQDIKNNSDIADTVKRWYFEVTSNVANDTVRLLFVNDRIPEAFGKYLTDLTTGERVNLKTISEYQYYNTADLIRRFMIVIGDSTAPMVSIITPNGNNIWRSSTEKDVQWSSSDGTGIQETQLSYSSDGGTNYTPLASLAQEQNYLWTIPNEYLNHGYGVKLIVTDSLGNSATVTSAKTFTVVGDSLGTSNTAGWSLVSVPLAPIDSSTISMFGTASAVWSYAQVSGYTEPNDIHLGNGYWLGVTAQKDWHVKGTAVEAESTIQTLTEGYNIIGNAFVRSVPKQNLSFIKSNTQYSFDSAASAGLISNILYQYNGTGYSETDTMSVFNGYWLAALQSGIDMVQKPSTSQTVPLTKRSQIMAADWEIKIKAVKANLTDDIFTFGIKSTTTSGFDASYDAPRPPRIPGNGYLDLYTMHSGGNYPQILGEYYAKDYRDANSASWLFTVNTKTAGDVTLSWDTSILEALAGNVDLKLTDLGSNQTVDMRTIGSYTFVYSSPSNFLIIGTVTGVQTDKNVMPKELSLLQNYPNPFNPSTFISFALPKTSYVTLKVFDVLGREVATLVNGEQSAGYKSVEWNAASAPSGIYFYRLHAGSFVETKKLLLMK